MTGLFADINSIKVVDKYEQTTILVSVYKKLYHIY